jgi:membrane protease YdiL (CAAX protease family)
MTSQGAGRPAGKKLLAGAGLEAAAGTLALGYGLVLHRLLPRRLHILTNPLAAVALTGLAHAAGVTAAGQGLARARRRHGLIGGLAVAAPLAGAIAGAVALPATRRYFYDRRLTGLPRSQALYEALVRVPVATALAEEVVFRGALLGILLRRHPPARAVAISSALFGVWHLLPTPETLDNSPAGVVTSAAGVLPPALAPAVAPSVTVLATAGAGWGLAILRLRSGSVLAPALAHATLNSAALIGSWLVSRREREPAHGRPGRPLTGSYPDDQPADHIPPALGRS